MRLSERLKCYLPITFAIIVICLFIALGIICIIGINPIKKNKDLGIGLICYGVFAGFYTGMCLGHLIAYLLNKCIPKPITTLQINNV
jgi:hypothetical protein